ncbi:MAG: hypothetical protein LBT86_06135 [Deltaproteobacteria bacterium]|nr:hypothetical protein [Deltaproteobacteria bacterium]
MNATRKFMDEALEFTLSNPNLTDAEKDGVRQSLTNSFERVAKTHTRLWLYTGVGLKRSTVSRSQTS